MWRRAKYVTIKQKGRSKSSMQKRWEAGVKDAQQIGRSNLFWGKKLKNFIVFNLIYMPQKRIWLLAVTYEGWSTVLFRIMWRNTSFSLMTETYVFFFFGRHSESALICKGVFGSQQRTHLEIKENGQNERCRYLHIIQTHHLLHKGAQ